MNQKCQFCGTPLAGYETFCPGCGRDLPTAEGAGFRPDTAEDTFEPIPAATPASAHSMSDDEWFPTDFAEPDPVPKPAAPQRRSPARTPMQPAAPKRSAPRKPAAQPVTITGRSRMILLASLTVAAVLLIALGISLLRGGDDRVVYPFTPVMDTYFTAVRTANAEKFIATRPAAYTAYLTSGGGSPYDNEGHYRSETAASLHARLDGYKAQYGSIREITYDLTAVNRYNHRCEALSDVLTGWYDFPENTVSDAYIVSGTYTVRGDSASGEHAINELLLIQIDGEWYFSPDAGSYWKGE